jgi:hypothetical protein
VSDARFQDGEDRPLHLMVREAGDVAVLSALLQDAVLPVEEISLDRRARRLGLLVNRFRWEDRAAAEAAGRGYERVRSLLVIEDVLALQSTGFDRRAPGLVLSILALRFEPGVETTGRLVLTLAGGGAIAVDVEALEARLEDVTRPYLAPSGLAPSHPD